MSLFAPSRDNFVKDILRKLDARQVQGTYKPETFSVSTSTGLDLYLGNVYAEVCVAPLWNRGKLIERFLSILDADPMSQGDEPFETAREHLMPKVRERMYTEQIRLRKISDGKPVELAQKVFAEGHLTLEVVYDTPRFTKSMRPAKLQEWGLTLDDALAIANENLKRRSGNGGFAVIQPGLYVSTWRDTFDASRLALQDFVTQLEVKGRIVAMVPNRDVLIVTGEGDTDGLVKMASMCEKVLKDPRPMIGMAFRLDAGWVPFLPPEDHPAYRSLKVLQLQSLAEIYGEQKAAVDQQNVERNIDVFVASFLAYANPTGSPISMSSWTATVDTLLPQTDLIGFVGLGPDDKPGRMIGQAKWNDVMRVCPNLLEPQGMYPERYRTLGFPTDSDFEAIHIINAPESR